MLDGLYEKLEKVPAPWTAEPLNKAMSLFLYEKREQLVNEDVFFLMRFIITANTVGAPVGEIMEIIGKKESLRRIEEGKEWLKRQL